MEQKKVTLPRKVAEAIENLLKTNRPSRILWKSSRPENEKSNDDWQTLYDFVAITGNNFLLSDALRYGYEVEPDEVEPEPGTITVTPDQLEKIKKIYNDHRAWSIQSRDGWYVAYCGGFEHALKLVGIKIRGVNE